MTTKARIITSDGPLELFVGSALSEYDVEASDGIRSAGMREPKRYTRYANASTKSGTYTEPGESLTINGVDYSTSITLHEIDGAWKLDGVSMRRGNFGDPTDAARRRVWDAITPEVITWIESHPREVAAMEQEALEQSLEGIRERERKILEGIERLRDHADRINLAAEDARRRAREQDR